jgi:hypothetical protein
MLCSSKSVYASIVVLLNAGIAPGRPLRRFRGQRIIETGVSIILAMNREAAIAAWSLAAALAVPFLLAGGHYDAFRNELYFIVCGRHPAFGYVDQPPLVPLIAALTQAGGVHVFLLRVPAILAIVLLVPLTVAFAQLLGATTRAAWLAAVAIAGATMLTAMSATLNTSTFEPLLFTGVAYLITRAYLRNEPALYRWAGVAAGISFETRYGILMWAAGLLIGILVAGPRPILRSRDFWIGAGIAVLIALPNVIWQAAHGFPFLELVRNDNSGNLIGTPGEFALMQVLTMNFLLVPLWLTGIIAPFVSPRLKEYRFLSIAFVVTVIIVLASHGKAYYTTAAYPTMFALGAAAATRLWRTVIAIWAILAALNALPALPFVLALEPPATLKYTIDHSKFNLPPMERAGIGAPLMQVLSDEFGWRDLARTVDAAYAALPARQRSKTAIWASNYGEAAAIDVYGHGLPPAISGNNQYFLWGTHGFDGSAVLAVNGDPAEWSQLCASSRIVATFGTSPYSMPYERHRPIVLCTGMHEPFDQVLPRFKHYGIENLGQRPVDRREF